MKRVMEITFLMGMILALAGCSSSKQTGQGDVPGLTTDRGTTLDMQQAGETSGDAINLDVPPEGQTATKCTKDDDCKSLGDNFYCNCKGFCIQGECAKDINCGSENYCDPCDKKCHPRIQICKPCEADYQCTTDPESVCQGFELAKDIKSQPVCLAKCAPNGHCAGTTEYQCTDVGNKDYWLCLPKSGSCTQKNHCKKDEDCKYGQICHPLTHMCVQAQCENDLQCGYPDTKKVCSMGRCVDACSTDANGKVTGCTQPKPDWAKDRPWICEKGHCKIQGACFSPMDCPDPETYCDSVTHQCKPGCKIDIDCKDASKICVNNKCVDKGCSHNYECAFGQVCNKTTGKCEDAPPLYCKACKPSQQNKSGDCGDPNTMCLTLKDKDGNEEGSFCFPACQGDPKDVDTCPQGYQCAEIKEQDQNGNVKNTYHQCFRDCTAGKENGQNGGQ